jgi:hypothetical protein
MLEVTVDEGCIVLRVSKRRHSKEVERDIPFPGISANVHIDGSALPAKQVKGSACIKRKAGNRQRE